MTSATVILSLAVLALALPLAVTAAPIDDFECPLDPNNDCITANYPDPDNCEFYYRCEFCQHRHEQCPNGEHFNADTGTCMDPKLAGCMPFSEADTTTVPPTTAQTVPPTTESVPPTTQTVPPTTIETTTVTTAAETTTQLPTTAAETTTQLPTTAAETTTQLPTTLSHTTSFPDATTSAFCTARQSVSDGPRDPLFYSTIFHNDGNAYNPRSGVVRVPTTGTYFFHMSAGAAPGKPMHLDLNGTSYPADLDRTSYYQTGPDTLCISLVTQQNAGDQLSVALPSDHTVYSDSFMQTSLSGFSLDEYMTSVDAFMATAPGVVSNMQAPIPFPNVLVNVGGGFDGNTKFIAPKKGDYYFSVSIGVDTATSVRVDFVKNSATPVSELWRPSTEHNGPDTLAKGITIHLNVGESMQVFLEAGSTYNEGTIRTSFAGFLLSPNSGPAHSWCVQATSMSTAPTTEELNPLPFQEVLLDDSQLWDAQTNTVTVKVSGVYFIQVTAGVQSNLPVDVRLEVDGLPSDRSVDAYRSVPYNNYYDTLSRGIMVPLQVGNTLRLVLASGTGTYSDSDKQTTFMGFFVGTS